MATRIVLLSVTDAALVREDPPRRLIGSTVPILVPLTRLNGATVHISRVAIALVEDDHDLPTTRRSQPRRPWRPRHLAKKPRRSARGPSRDR